MIKGKDSIAFLLYGEYKEKLGYLSKLGISFVESNEIISEIFNQYNLGIGNLINYNQEIENLIDNEIRNKIDWNNFNFTEISRFVIDDIFGVASGYILRIFRLIFKDYLYCSHIDDGDSEASALNKSQISVGTYRAHCKNILDSLKMLFFKYYSGSTDASNILNANDDAFLLSEVKNMKKFNILLIKYCISHFWINILRYKEFKFRKNRNNVSFNFNNHIYCDPILTWNIFDNSFKNSEISNFIISLDLKNIKNEFINKWLGEEYYKILDKEFSTSYNFSYSTFHKSFIPLIIMMKIEMSDSYSFKNVYTRNVKYTSITWYQNLGFSDYFIKIFKEIEFSDENISELKRFINDNTVKFQDLNNWKIIQNNKLNGAFVEVDEVNVVTILLEFLYLSYLKNDLMLNIFNAEQKQQMTFKLGKVFEKRYSEYIMKTIDKNGNIINNDRFSFIENNPNVKLKNILELNIQDELETDVLFYNKNTDTIYVIELKNIIRKDYTWQDLETVWELEKDKGWKEKLKKRVIFLQENIEKLSSYIPEVSKATKIRGIIAVSKPVLATSHFWKDELGNEYFLCLPSIVEYIQLIGKINDDGSFELLTKHKQYNNYYKNFSPSYT